MDNMYCKVYYRLNYGGPSLNVRDLAEDCVSKFWKYFLLHSMVI